MQEMEKKNAVKLSAMERNQIETNKRLEDVMNMNKDVMNSNKNLQSMLQIVLSGLTNNDVSVGKILPDKKKQVIGESS